jgi:hypothetical protein
MGKHYNKGLGRCPQVCNIIKIGEDAGMECPFEGEDTLPQILNERQELIQEIATKVREFKVTLAPEQRQAFNLIDDLMQTQITLAQQDTLTKIHCPTCRSKSKKCQ